MPDVCRPEVASGRGLSGLLHGQAPGRRPSLPAAEFRTRQLELAWRLLCAASRRVAGASAAGVAPVAQRERAPIQEEVCRMTARDSEFRVRVPHGFYAGAGAKVHLGYERRGDVVMLACGMSGHAWWLTATDRAVNCGSCLRSNRA